jgi:erythritol kinase (D-erythritol 1-phosphate-forming)
VPTLCLDAGTSLLKAVVFDDAGVTLASAHRPTTIDRPRPGFAEQDMDGVWVGAVAVLREAAQRADVPIDAIALTAQGDGCWLINGDGAPTGPAILWNDARAAAAVVGWMDDGTVQRAFAHTGSTTFAGLPSAILPWLREHEPERIARAAAALTCGSFLFMKLSGTVALDVSDASAPWLDARTQGYAPEVLELLDLEWARALLPPLRRATDAPGALTAEAARALGLRAGTPVVPAPYDIAATAIGAGAIAPGDACSILGTTLCTEVVVDRVDTSGAPSGFTIALGAGDLRLRAHPTLAGTEVLQWAARLLGLEGAAEIPALAARAAPGAGGLVVLPYLSPAGERAPFLAPEARGTVFGLTVEHSREDFARAVLESLSHVVRECVEAAVVAPAGLALCGGGAASDVWCRLIADVTGLPTTRPADAEVGAKGACVVAAVATGAARDLGDAVARLVPPPTAFTPDPETRALHDDRHRAFLAARAATQPSWRALAS